MRTGGAHQLPSPNETWEQVVENHTHNSSLWIGPDNPEQEEFVMRHHTQDEVRDHGRFAFTLPPAPAAQVHHARRKAWEAACQPGAEAWSDEQSANIAR